MEAIWSVASGVLAVSLTFWLGLRLGLRYRKMKRWQNAVVWGSGVLLGVLICVVGLLQGLMWLWVAGLAVMAGSLSGVRYGHNRVDDERKRAAREAARQVAADAAGQAAQESRA
jgi:hypothetical protein